MRNSNDDPYLRYIQLFVIAIVLLFLIYSILEMVLSRH